MNVSSQSDIKKLLAQAKEFMVLSRQALRWVWQELTRIQQETEQDKAETATHIEHFIKDVQRAPHDIKKEPR